MIRYCKGCKANLFEESHLGDPNCPKLWHKFKTVYTVSLWTFSMALLVGGLYSIAHIRF